MAESEVIRAFSRASASYEEQAVVQRLCARDLLQRLDMTSPRSVLEVGCGTGLFTRLLAGRFPQADILACDPAPGMLLKAGQALPAGVELAGCGIDDLPRRRWDLIISNAALQWAGPLRTTLPALKERLAPGGCLAFSYFTRNAYPELAEALSRAAGQEIRLACSDFASTAEVEEEITGLFANSLIERRIYTQEFADLTALLRHIRLTGTRGTGARPGLNWTRGLLERTQREYLARCGCIRAGYEVVLCTAR